MPLRPLVLLSVLLHLYAGLRLLPALPAWAGLALAAGLLASALLMPLGMGVRQLAGRRVAPGVTWAGLLCMGAFSSLLVLVLLRDALLLAAWLGVLAGLDIPLDALARISGQAAAPLALGASALGFRNARRTASVRRVDVPIAGLAPALHGFSIVQLSDLHVGPTIGERYLQAVVDRVNTLDADLVAITGDLVDGPAGQLAPQLQPLTRIRSRDGTFFVTGNHEYYSGAGPWLAVLRGLGVQVLENAHVLLERGDGAQRARLLLAGVTDFTAGHFDAAKASSPARAMAGAPPGLAVRVLLAHQPRSAPAAAAAGFDVQLSGHTHGGQFWPWNLFVPLQQPFTAGLHRLGRLWVYTSRGTGYWGPPKRFGAPSEITLLRLVSGAAD